MKFVDFKSEISLDNWNYLLEIASYLIELSPKLKGLICAFYGNNFIIHDLNLIIKFYNILTFNGTGTVTATGTVNTGAVVTGTAVTGTVFTGTVVTGAATGTFNLLLRHVLVDKLNYFNFIKFLKSLNYSSTVLIEIFYEFFMSESKEKEIFIIKLLLCQICDCVSDGFIPSALYNFNTKTFNYCKSGNWDLLYKSLVINTLTKTVPNKLKEQFEFLCQICDLNAKELKVEIEIEIEFAEALKEARKYSFNAGSCVYFKENFAILTSNITAFNCLTQLLKLLEQFNFDNFNYFINYIRKRKGSNDLYFNLLFIE